MLKRLSWLTVPVVLVWSTIAAAAPTRSFSAATGSLPGDIEILGASNLKTVRSTQLFQKLFPQALRMNRDVSDGLDKVKKTCGIDPLTAIDDITVGVDRAQKGGIFVAVTGVTEQKFVECVTKIAKAEAGETLTSKKTGSILELKNDKSGKTLYLGWLAGDVLVFGSDPTDKALLERVLGGKGALSRGRLAGRLTRATPDAAMTVIWSKELPVENMTMKGGELMVGYQGGTVTASTTLEMASSKEAENVSMATKALSMLLGLPKDAPPEIEKLIKSVTATTNGGEVKISAQGTEADILKAVEYLLKPRSSSAGSSKAVGPRR